MRNQGFGMAIFALGALILHLYTTTLYLWALVNMSLRTFPLMLPPNLRGLIGFTPPLGALLLVMGSLLYGLQGRR